MKTLAEIFRAEGVNASGKTVYRTAARAIVPQGGRLLMVYSSAD